MRPSLSRETGPAESAALAFTCEPAVRRGLGRRLSFAALLLARDEAWGETHGRGRPHLVALQRVIPVGGIEVPVVLGLLSPRQARESGESQHQRDQHAHGSLLS